MSSYSVKMMTRVSFHLAGVPRACIVPSGGRSGHMFCRIQSTSLRTRASGRPLAASAISVISSRSCFSRAKASVPADVVSRVAASIWASSSAWSSSSESVARSSSLSTPSAKSERRPA